MKARILTALVGIPLVLGILFAAPHSVFGLFVLALALVALAEFNRICGITGHVAFAVLVAGALLLAAVPPGMLPAAAPAAGVLLLAGTLWRVHDPTRRFRDLAAGVLGLCYIGYGLGSLWPLRTRADGPAWIFLLFAATWAGDSAAYFAGTRWGRRRLAPSLSPGKTWVGAAAGLAGSCVGGLSALPLFGGEISPWLAVGAAAAVGIAGQIGDLFESLWKRAAGVKDSGSLIPGHGGVLDRIDSLLLAIPVLRHVVWVWGG